MKKQIKAFHFSTLFMKWTFTTHERKSSKLGMIDGANQGEITMVLRMEEGFCFFFFAIFSSLHANACQIRLYNFSFQIKSPPAWNHHLLSNSLFVIYISFHYLHQIRYVLQDYCPCLHSFITS